MVFSKANALQLKPVLLYGGKNGNFIQACRLKRAKVRDQKFSIQIISNIRNFNLFSIKIFEILIE